MTKNKLKHNFKHKIINNTSNVDNSNSGFVLGIVSAVLLIACVSVLLVFNNKQVQRIITKKISYNGQKVSDIQSLINDSHSLIEVEKTLNVKAEHPNGTVGRLTNISFTKQNTIVEMVVTNGSLYTIYLNLHGKGVVLVDDLGNKYNFKLPADNPDLEIESGQSFKGELVFEGGVTAKANSLTLITNNQIGSDQSLSRRPKIEFYIPLKQLFVNSKNDSQSTQDSLNKAIKQSKDTKKGLSRF